VPTSVTSLSRLVRGDADELLGLLEGERLQEDRVDDGEDRGVRADPEASVATATAVNPGLRTSIRSA
jgi:hypothetical protein